MAKDPAMLFYTSDFLTATMTMTDEQVGKYIRLLCFEHQHGRMREKDMLIICKSYDEDIYNKFVVDKNGFYYNERLEEEFMKRKTYSESRKANRTGKKKKSDEDMKDTCKTYVPHMDNEIIDDIDNSNVLSTSTIVQYLNQKASTNFKPNIRKTQDLIKARFNEGYTEQDFFTVIDKKVSEWLNTEMAKYIRPETLFSNKFEGYLNQKNTTPKPAGGKSFAAPPPKKKYEGLAE